MIHIFILLALLELFFLLFGSSSIQNISSSHLNIVVSGVVEVLHFLLLVVSITVELVHALAVIALFTLMDHACRLTRKTISFIRNALNAVTSRAVKVKEALINYPARFVRLFDEIAQGGILAYDEGFNDDDDPSDDTSQPPIIADFHNHHQVGVEDDDVFKNAHGNIQVGIFPFEESYFVPAEDPYEHLEDVKGELVKEKAARQVAVDCHKQEIAEEMEKRKAVEERLEEIEKERNLERTAMEAELRESKEVEKALKAELAVNDEELEYVKSELETEKAGREEAEDSHKQENLEALERRSFVVERLEQVEEERMLERRVMEVELVELREAAGTLEAELAVDKGELELLKSELEREKSARQGVEAVHNEEIAEEQEKRRVVEESLEQVEKEQVLEKIAMENKLRELEDTAKILKAEIEEEKGKRTVAEQRLEQVEKERMLEKAPMETERREFECVENELEREKTAVRTAEDSLRQEMVNGLERMGVVDYLKEQVEMEKNLERTAIEMELEDSEFKAMENTFKVKLANACNQEEDNGHKLDLTALKKMFENRDKPKQVEEAEQTQKGAPPPATPVVLKQDLQDPVAGNLTNDKAPVEGKSSSLDNPPASSAHKRKNNDKATELINRTEISSSSGSSMAPLPAPVTPKKILAPHTSPKFNRKRGDCRPANNDFPVNNQFPVTSTPIRHSVTRNSHFRGRPNPGHFSNRGPQPCHQAYYQPNNGRPQDVLYHTGTVQRSVLAPRDLNRR